MAKTPRPTSSKEARVSVINATTTPLAYMVLALLVIETTIGVFGYRMPDPATPLLLMIGTTVLFVVAILLVATFKPGVLSGDRPFTDHAEHFAAYLYLGADGAFRNLPASEREQAWTTLADIIGSQAKKEDSYADFCIAVAARVRLITKIAGGTNQALGAIRPNQGGV